METSTSWMQSYGMFFEGLDDIILGIFIIELVLKLYAFGYKYFLNKFDTISITIMIRFSATVEEIRNIILYVDRDSSGTIEY